MNADQSIAALQREILRWNHQISLVSRVGAEGVLSEQVDQCRRAWTLLVEAFTAGDAGETTGSWDADCCWIDVGSGSGLPGLVWAAQRQAQGWGGTSVLVEPREKRAWFLKRAARAMGLAGVEVLDCRWGEQVGATRAGDVKRAIVSFKALRMPDSEVLGGFGGDPGLLGVEDVAVVRFLWPEAWALEQLVDEFGGGDGVGGGWGFAGAEVLGAEQLRLLVSRYRRQV